MPKLRDKRQLVNAMKDKLATEMANNVVNGQFKTELYTSALNDSLREQKRLQRLRPHAKKDGSPIRGGTVDRVAAVNIASNNAYNDRLIT